MPFIPIAHIWISRKLFVAHVNYWGDVHLKNLGSVRGNYISPVKDALEAGLVYNFHTDTPDLWLPLGQPLMDWHSK